MAIETAKNLRYRSLLVRAIGVALALEALLLIPQNAEADFCGSQPVTNKDGKTSRIQFWADLRDSKVLCRKCGGAANTSSMQKCTGGSLVATSLGDCKVIPGCATMIQGFQKLAANGCSSANAVGTCAEKKAVAKSSGSSGSSTKGTTTAGTGGKAGTTSSTSRSGAASGSERNSVAGTHSPSGSKTQDAPSSSGKSSEAAQNIASGAVAGKSSSSGSADQGSNPGFDPSKPYQKLGDNRLYKDGKPTDSRMETYIQNGKEYDVEVKDEERGRRLSNGQELIVDTKTGETYIQGGPTAEDISRAKEARKRKDSGMTVAQRKELAKKKKQDPCLEAGDVLGENFQCKSTYKTIKGANTANTVSQIAGQAMIQKSGQAGFQQAAQSGTMSETHAQAAKQFQRTAALQATIGAVNLMYSNKTGKNAQRHAGNVDDLASEREVQESLRAGGQSLYQYDKQGNLINAGDSHRQRVIEADKLNDKYGAMMPDHQARLTAVETAAEKKLGRFEKQQQTAQMDSLQAKGETKMEAIKQFIGMAGSVHSAASAKKNAKLLKAAEQKRPVQYNFAEDSGRNRVNVGSGALNDGTQQGGDPVNADPSMTDLLGSGSDYNLGDGNGDSAGGTGIAGPPPAQFSASGSPGGGLGGNGGVGGAGGSAPEAPNMGGEGQGQYVGSFGGKDSYEGTGSLTRGAGGGNRGGAGESGGIDLNSLLAKFLPSDEQTESAPSVLETQFGGGRGLAAVESAPSLLDQKADLFGRIHDLYQEKHAKGLLGNK